ncbi:MAG: hypothetical protein Q8920_08940 [Bacillota bacterium]|nr:hypothetical protein [Bacillota bacterium]
MLNLASIKRGNVKKVTIIILIIFVLTIVALNFIPIKNCINIKDIIDRGNKAIICKHDQVTGASWVVIGDSDGLFEEGKGEYIDIIGNIPDTKLNSSVLLGDNEYLFEGSFVETKELHGERYRVFNVTDWDMVNPIDRASLRGYISPRSYLNIFDFLF